METDLIKLGVKSGSRFDFWINFINKYNIKSILEIGVYRGEFAENLLKNCPSIQNYYMIDPWRNLENWNKPANTNNDKFAEYYQETLLRTNFASSKRIILKGTTTEVINQVSDNSIDLIYIDGDHTLKGITLDLLKSWNKVKANGFIAGDDFSPSIWQHSMDFEPTLVFPFAKHFAEAMNVKIFGLIFNQFLITRASTEYEFLDLNNGIYKNENLLAHITELKRVESPNIYPNSFLYKIKKFFQLCLKSFN